MPTFTREQQIAQSADRHLAVTAGAGAGKTSVLVQRFVHLLLDESIRADVRQITAITFTRKAAAEMHHRISQEIEKRLADPSEKSKWKRIKQVRERFSSANISTIHSFCARLLREFPIEGKVNPNFTELEEHEGVLMKEHAILDTLEAWLEEKDESALKKRKKSKKISDEEWQKERETEDLKRLAARNVWLLFGKKRLSDMLNDLLKSQERFNDLTHFYRQNSNEALLRQIEREFIARFLNSVQEYLVSLEGAWQSLALDAFAKTTRPALENAYSTIGILKKQTEELQSLLSLTNTDVFGEAETGSISTSSPKVSWKQALALWENIDKTLLANDVMTSGGIFHGNKIRRNSEKNFTDKDRYVRLVDDAEEIFKSLKDLAQVMPNHIFDRAMLENIRILIDIARDAWQTVKEEKERLGALDFNDLELKADALLDNPDVCDKIRMTTRFLMIDEFQDTNELQYRLARKIIRNLGVQHLPSEEISASTTNLFIVGDPKQSIYSFRGADVRVFAKAKRDIEALNRHLLAQGQFEPSFSAPKSIVIPPESEPEKLGNIGLRATFRLLPEIAAFVNRVAGDQLRRTTTEFDVEYDDIVCGASGSELQGTVTMLLARQPFDKESAQNYSASEQNFPASNEDFSSFDGNIDTFFGEQPEINSDVLAETPNFLSEAELLAEYIKAMCNGSFENPVMVRSSAGSPRMPTFSDIMILVRSRSNMDELLAALRRCKIPFTQASGRGFFERQEILDIRSFLLFLQNAADDIALAALLRSPFFAVTDSELYAISRTEASSEDGFSTGSLWQRFGEYCNQSEDNLHVASSNALRSYSVLKSLLPLAAQLSIPSLIRTILEDTAWRGMIAADERFDQIEANLEKLLILARKYENKGFRNLYDFAEELRRLAQYANNEGEADAAAARNTVQIMTIHGAKGLEAPIIALYNTNSAGRKDDKALSFDSMFGTTFKMLRAREDGTMEYVPTPLHYLASAKDTQAKKAELKRLLYVALTRPKDHLIISGKALESKKGGMNKPTGFLEMILESLGVLDWNLLVEPSLPFPSEALEILLDGKVSKRDVSYSIPIIRAKEQFLSRSHTPQNLDAEALSSEAVLNEAVLNEAENLTSAERQTIENNVISTSSPLPILLLGGLPTNVSGDMYSASQLQLFAYDPDEFERRYRLGLPAADENGYFTGFAASADGEDDGVTGSDAGKIIHAVLERLPDWLTVSGEVRPQEYQQGLERVTQDFGQIFSPALLARVQRETQAVAATPLVKRYAEALAVAEFEREFMMPFGNDFLKGTIDVLLKNASGALEIWDWKTNRVGSARDMEKLVGEYRLQLEIYALIASYLAPEQQTFTARLLFTRRATASAKEEEWTRTLEFTRLDVASVQKKIEDLIREIRATSYGIDLE